MEQPLLCLPADLSIGASHKAQMEVGVTGCPAQLLACSPKIKT